MEVSEKHGWITYSDVSGLRGRFHTEALCKNVPEIIKLILHKQSWTVGAAFPSRLFSGDEGDGRRPAGTDVHGSVPHPGDLSDLPDLHPASVSAAKGVSDMNRHSTVNISDLVYFNPPILTLKKIKRGKKAHQSHTLSPFIGVFSLLRRAHGAGRGAFDLPCRASSAAHFHKSHVGVFVARATLTRGHSPNTEPMSQSRQAATERLYGRIHQHQEEVGKFMWRRRGNVLSSEER